MGKPEDAGMTFEQYEYEHLFALTECAKKLVRMGWNARGEFGDQAAPQPAQQDMYRRLADKYRQDLFECQDELNNLRSEYHNRMAELEGEIEELRPAQQGSVQESKAFEIACAFSAYSRDSLGKHGVTEDQHDEWFQILKAALAATPQPEGDGWIRCSDIAPVIRQLEQYDVRADEHGGKHVCKSFAYQLRQITGLKRPTPPQER